MSSKTEDNSFADAASDYLERHRVYEMFHHLLKNLVIQRPNDPISFLISQLEEPEEKLRIVVVAPPNPALSSYTQLITHITERFGVARITVPILVEDEILRQSPLGDKAKAYLDRGQPVPDDILIPLISARLSKSDCAAKGWVLEGFPSTAAQARQLQAAGGFANKCVVLDVPATTLKLRLADDDADAATPTARAAAAAVAARAGSSVEGDDGDFYSHAALRAIERRAEAILSSMASVAALYPGCAYSVSDALPSATVLAAVDRFLAQDAPSAAPRRPARVVLLGPRGAGKSRAAKALADKTGVVRVSVGSILASERAAESRAAAQAEPYTAMGELVPDDVIVPLVLARLQQQDCAQHGWVLEGFPRSLRQATLLAKAGVLPSRCVLLEAPDQVCIDRVTPLRWDPVTGDVHNVKTGPLPATVVMKRLQHQTSASEPIVRSIVNNYRTGIEQIRHVYRTILLEVDGTRPADEVAEDINAFVAAPLRAGDGGAPAAGGSAASRQ
jgi:adenylate kinase